jgi:undecaprenyl-diphosphatase
MNGVDEPRARRSVSLGTALAASAVVVLLALLVMADAAPLVDLDLSIDSALHDWALGAPWSVSLARFLERIGRVGVSFWVVLAVTIVLLLRRRWRTAAALVTTAILAPIVTDQIKPLVDRARPVWDVPLSGEQTLSYPSGHATAGIAVYLACGLALASLITYRRGRAVVITVFAVVGISIGLSRPVLGVHWPSDVVGGWAVAVAVGAAAVALWLPQHRRTIEPSRASHLDTGRV